MQERETYKTVSEHGQEDIPDRSCTRELGMRALADCCPQCGWALDLPPPLPSVGVDDVKTKKPTTRAAQGAAATEKSDGQAGSAKRTTAYRKKPSSRIGTIVRERHRRGIRPSMDRRAEPE
mgnify:CR=1 FL=1